MVKIVILLSVGLLRRSNVVKKSKNEKEMFKV